jgi:ParB family chromosome partitioning protein
LTHANTNGAGHEDETGADGAKPAAKEKGGLPAALIAELTSHKTVAAQLVLAGNPAVAMMAVTHALATRMLYPTRPGEHTSLEISAHSPSYTMAVRETVEKSAPAKKLTAVVKSWQKKLPKKPEDLWAWLAKQPPATLRSLMAVCAALTVDMVRVNGAKAKPAATDLAKAMKLDMADHWEATAANYFIRVPRKRLLDELGGALKPNTRKQVQGMKRDMAAKTIATELKGRRWIPDVLKAG